MIKIVSISSDRKSCLDIHGVLYSINDVKQLGNSISVLVAHKVVNGNTIEYIKYRKNQKIKPFSNYVDRIENYVYNCNAKVTMDLNVVLEDSGSAKRLILSIVEYFAIKCNIKINCKLILAGGNSFIVYNLVKNVDKNSKCLVIYDSAVNYNIVQSVKRTILYLSKEKNIKFVHFYPRCIEECALTFKTLQDDIIGLNVSDIDILKAINHYFKTGMDYISINPVTLNDSIAGHDIIFSGKSIYTKKNINNIEQYLAHFLAKITDNKPYRFNKHCSTCWYNNCKSNVGRCNLEEILGINRNKKSDVDYCNKTLLNQDKILVLMQNSLFLCIYIALDKLCNNKNYKLGWLSSILEEV